MPRCTWGRPGSGTARRGGEDKRNRKDGACVGTACQDNRDTTPERRCRPRRTTSFPSSTPFAHPGGRSGITSSGTFKQRCSALLAQAIQVAIGAHEQTALVGDGAGVGAAAVVGELVVGELLELRAAR